MDAKEKQVILTAGLGYGDEGKGTMVDYLTRLYGAGLVVRYNGGAQAGHNVVDSFGRCHTFSQFGSGTLVSGTKTHLSESMIVNPLSMMREHEHLVEIGMDDALQRLTIDERALVTTPFQIAQNRLLEIQRGANRYGSCGLGIGQTIDDFKNYGSQVLSVGDLVRRSVLRKKLWFIREEKLAAIEPMVKNLGHTEAVERELSWFGTEVFEFLVNLFSDFGRQISLVDESYLANQLSLNQTVIFEGAQGILLDNIYGFWPHVTKTDITFNQAYRLLAKAGYQGVVSRLGILRAYATRHGAGPLVTEDIELGKKLVDTHNKTNDWQESFRVGWFDLLAVKYALAAIGGVDSIAMTNLDRIDGLDSIKVCIAYEYQGGSPEELESYFESTQDNAGRLLITGIKVLAQPSHEYQGKLAGLLAACRPVYIIIRKQDYLKFIKEKFGVPVSIVSYGPMAKDKVYI